MNAERLHAVILALRSEMTQTAVVKKMQNLVNSLDAVVQGSNASTQQTLATSLSNFYAALSEAPSDAFSPGWRQILREMGVEELFGNRLAERVKTSLAKNQITPAVAAQELQEILKKLEQVENALSGAASAFQIFGIGSEKLQPGEAEIGLLVPRQAVKNELLDFADELKELGFILNTFSEVATGETDQLKIKTISSSDLLVYLQACAPYAACLAVAVERVIALYKQLLEIRKLHQEILNHGVPDDKTAGIEQFANELMEKGIEKAAGEIVDKFYEGNDKGRKHELVVKVRISMNKIANRVDQGYSVEVRVAAPSADDPKAKDEAYRNAVELIQSISPTLEFLKLEGPPLLKLPETTEKLKKKEKATASASEKRAHEES